MPELYKSPNVPEENLSAATVVLLTKLFSDVGYSIEEKLFFQFLFENGIENFISGEIFTAHMIRLNSADKQADVFFCQMGLAYLLHQRHNAKLNRGTPQNFHMETFDIYLYDILCSFAHYNYPYRKERNRDLFDSGDNRGINFFNKLHETFFCFVSPFSNIQYVWSGNNCQAEKNSQLNITVYGYDNEFCKYVKSLLEMKYNSRRISGQKRQEYSQFLESVAGITRSKKTEYTLPYCRTPKVDLLIFCIVLGYNSRHFNRLIQLRDKGRSAGINPTNPDNPFSEDSDEMKFFIKYLDKSAEKNFNYIKNEFEKKLKPEENLENKVCLQQALN